MDNIIAAFEQPLDPNSAELLYEQLEKRILQLIATGVLDDGAALPTEKQLSEVFNLSRATVRHCFEDLVKAGHVRRRRGQGTFVSRQTGRRDISRALNFFSEIRALGMVPSSKVISFQTVPCQHSIAKQLHIADNSLVWRIHRVRLADGKPVLLTTSFVPTSLCPHLNKEDLEHSLYSTITEQSNALPARSEEIYDAICLGEQEAKQLQIETGAPAFRIHRASMDTKGRTFEVSVIIEPADKYKFKVSTNSNEIHFQKIYDF